MQLMRHLFALCALVYSCLALQAKNVHLTFPGSQRRGILLGDIESQTQKLEEPVQVNAQDESLELNFAVSPAEKPEQVELLVGLPERGLEVVYEPKITDNKELIMYRFSIDVSKIPKALLHYSKDDEEPISVSMILASPESDNVFVLVFDMSLTFNDEVEYTEPVRYEAKPEIRHVFNPEPKTVPWPLAQVFVFIISLVVFGLVIALMSSGALNFGNLPLNFNIVYFFAFIGSIIGFEYIFIQYYIGKSIFETLLAALYLGFPALWVGTKFLRIFKCT